MGIAVQQIRDALPPNANLRYAVRNPVINIDAIIMLAHMVLSVWEVIALKGNVQARDAELALRDLDAMVKYAKLRATARVASVLIILASKIFHYNAQCLK